jgi:hypothetical protein
MNFVSNGDTVMLDTILELGGNLLCTDACGRNILHQAVANKKRDAIRIRTSRF